MKKIMLKQVLLCLSFVVPMLNTAQVRTLDEFEQKSGWNFIHSDAVELNLSIDKGISGNALRFDYNFTKGTGYGGIQKFFPVDLPDNFAFTFYVKAESPANNFEIKLIDSTGNNVWWVSNRNYDFPKEWKKITIRKRHISFAWGPTNDQSLKRIDRIEFTIASFVGGKGSVWIDKLQFEPLPPETQFYPLPLVTASSSIKNHNARFVCDSLSRTYWQSTSAVPQTVKFDFKTRREFGGLQIDWFEGLQACDCDILLSTDGKQWEKSYTLAGNTGNTSFLRLPEAEARYLKINLKTANSPKGYGIREVKFLSVENTLTKNDFLIYAAQHSPPGYFPRYFLEQSSYWSITGVNNDVKESLISEDGMVEVDKALFSIEPMIRLKGELFNWNNVKKLQSMGPADGHKDFAFIPTVTWECPGLRFETGITATGEANKNSMLEISYSFLNTSDKPLEFEFYQLIRPFQVNPYYQFLNMAGGAGKIHSIKEESPGTIAVDNKLVLPSRKYDAFAAFSFDKGNIVEKISNGKMPSGKTATDNNGLACGAILYKIKLGPGEKTRFFTAVPYYDKHMPFDALSNSLLADEMEKSKSFWQNETGHIEFNLPPSADRIVNTYKSNLAYILVNRDKVGIQPGSRSYERSWIRDGALTSSALLKSGIVQEVKDFIDWYASYQFENGKVPCVVDFRGPDPVPENDSHGELIYLIREYFNFTHDTAFLRAKNEHVLKAVSYIESLVAERSTDYFKNGNDSVRSLYGLMPESISHEGYSAKPMHSYWDDFFTMKGLKDAAEIQKILGNEKEYKHISRTRDTFRKNLYNSISLAMKYHRIDYVPGCAELGDFDATSTTISLTPCNELKNMPNPQVFNTFDKYFTFFKNRRDGIADWINYTPYENRLIGSFVILDQPERAHQLIDFFLNDQRPQGWNHWAEVVWKDYRTPRYIGDIPHTWCGSDFLNAVRSMFVYENEYDQSLVVGAALYQDWIDAPGGMSVAHLPTYYGELSYTVNKEGNAYKFILSGDLNLPANGIEIRNFNGSKMPSKIMVNGSDMSDFTAAKIHVKSLPAEVVITY